MMLMCKVQQTLISQLEQVEDIGEQILLQATHLYLLKGLLDHMLIAHLLQMGVFL